MRRRANTINKQRNGIHEPWNIQPSRRQSFLYAAHCNRWRSIHNPTQHALEYSCVDSTHRLTRSETLEHVSLPLLSIGPQHLQQWNPSETNRKNERAQANTLRLKKIWKNKISLHIERRRLGIIGTALRKHRLFRKSENDLQNKKCEKK